LIEINAGDRQLPKDRARKEDAAGAGFLRGAPMSTSVVQACCAGDMRRPSMPMKRVRLELARDHEFPAGSRDRGYEFAAPLDQDGHLLADDWRTLRQRCRVKRFWLGQKDELGHLVHRRGGSWAFDYDNKRSDDDEPGFKFDRHHFIPGEYVSITEHDGVMRTFRVISVQDL
jgi:hypothetical protein